MSRMIGEVVPGASGRLASVASAVFVALATPSLGGESLVNGGAESGALAPWIRVPSTAPIAAVQQQPQTFQTVVPASGSFFFTFAAGAQSGTIALRQDGDVPAGVSMLRLSGRYQTELADFGEAHLRIFDADGALLEERSTGPLRNADEAWRPFSVQAPVPPRAATWQVELGGTLAAGSFINVFYDAVELGEPCSGDVDGSGSVDGADLSALLAAWGTANAAADLNADGVVGGADLSVLLAAWGACP